MLYRAFVLMMTVLHESLSVCTVSMLYAAVHADIMQCLLHTQACVCFSFADLYYHSLRILICICML